jgi:DnaJ-class molecular chaperone
MTLMKMTQQMDNYHKRKLERIDRFYKYEYRNKLIKCISCNGSGYYDNTDSPKCSSCNGTGKVRERE